MWDRPRDTEEPFTDPTSVGTRNRSWGKVGMVPSMLGMVPSMLGMVPSMVGMVPSVVTRRLWQLGVYPTYVTTYGARTSPPTAITAQNCPWAPVTPKWLRIGPARELGTPRGGYPEGWVPRGVGTSRGAYLEGWVPRGVGTSRGGYLKG